MKLLFICKKRLDSYGISFGLLNSAKFIRNALGKIGIECKVISVVDNNGIDKEVKLYNPTHVIIEAYWVVPSKFDILCKMYPKVNWIVRGHSKIPFFANEGIAMSWTDGYTKKMDIHDNFYLSFNDIETCNIIYYGFQHFPLYLPNIYCPSTYCSNNKKKKKKEKKEKKECPYIDIGCFGAVRPMKNTLQQAFASIRFANLLGKNLRFHINSSRVEQKGENVIKNIISLFQNSPHELVLHKWKTHEEFIKLVKSMDIGLQVSLSESFNIVGADFVSNHVPFIGMKDMRWLSFLYHAEPTNINHIIKKMKFAWYFKKMKLHYINNFLLYLHNRKSILQWISTM